jgi:CheY-like chemotaxis protein
LAALESIAGSRLKAVLRDGVGLHPIAATRSLLQPSWVSEKAAFLVVEDSEDDVVLLRRAFAKSRILNPIHVVKNGPDALAYLEGTGRFRDRQQFPLPRLILLDLKLPGMGGLDVLKWIREQPKFKGTRVIVLTASDLVRDVTAAYQLGANSFLIKPNDFEDLVRLTQAIQGYWIWTDVGPQGVPQDEPKKVR